MSHSSLSFVLHGHLPFIRHPEHPFHHEERWFYEAMHECYIPLLEMLWRLDHDNIPGKITLSLSAPLITMMRDPLLINRFIHFQSELIRLAEREAQRLSHQPEFQLLTQFYLDRFRQQKDTFQSVQQDILSAFVQLHHKGRIELITCVGTHGILPLLASDEGMAAQVKASVHEFQRSTGFSPSGVWLAECGYSPGVEKHLRNNNISFSFLEGSALLNAESEPVAGTFAPLISDEGVAFFGRDSLASAQVWSAKEGYPGDFCYREFYRDIGYDLPLDLIQDWVHPDGTRVNTGIKYHRITGAHVELGSKQLYDPYLAIRTAHWHGRDFVDKRISVANSVDTPPHLDSLQFTCPYDAELFGHWWFEGPHFLEGVLREAAQHDSISVETPVEYLSRNEVHQQSNPAPSTWGERGTFEFWVDPANVWVYPLLHDAELRFRDIVSCLSFDPDPLINRALNQAARELLLAQASDWTFIMKTGTTVEYAELRIQTHLERFHQLADDIEHFHINEPLLHSFEEYTPIFPEISWRYWLA